MKIIKGLRTGSAEGQSLVEMAIIAPILIFFLLGIFEVGWALRNYLVLVNTNREITRFAIRPGYLDFSTQANVTNSYNRVQEMAETSTSGQLSLDFDSPAASSTLIISHLVIDTGLPCKPHVTNCNCDLFDPDSADYNPDHDNVLKEDDIVIHPGMANYGYQSITYGPITTTTGTRYSRLNYEELTEELKDQNNLFNCQLIERNGIPSANNVIATELFHDQPQLFGFPIISNPFTDPFPLYTHTVMRLTGGARSSGGAGGSLIANIDTIGEVCFAHPFIVNEDDVPAIGNSPIEILNEGAANKGWVIWDPTPDDPTVTTGDIIQYQIQFPQMSVNGYENPTDSSDTVLDEEDEVLAENGLHMGQVKQYVENWIGQDIIIPTYDPIASTPSYYIVSGFIKVRILEVTGSNVDAVYLEGVPEACGGTTPPPP